MMKFVLFAIVPLLVVGYIAAYNLGRVSQRRGIGLNPNADVAISALRFIILATSVSILFIILLYLKNILW